MGIDPFDFVPLGRWGHEVMTGIFEFCLAMVACDCSPTLREGHRVVLNIPRLMTADETPFNNHPRDGTHLDESPCL